MSGEGVGRERLYTTTERSAIRGGGARRGRYLLAATFGNVHGRYKPADVRLRPEILREGQEALAAVHPGAHFQYVFLEREGLA